MISNTAKHIIAILKQHNFHKNMLYNRSLLAHLCQTYRIIKQWGNSDALALIGLCHSIYEKCEGYPKPGLNIEYRPIIADIIGPQQEELAHLFSKCEYNGSIIKHCIHEMRYVTKQDTDEKIYLPLCELNDLAEISAANMYEQMQYHQCRLTKEEMQSYLAPYLSAKNKISNAAIHDIASILQLKEKQDEC